MPTSRDLQESHTLRRGAVHERVVLEATRATLKIVPKVPQRAMPLLSGGRALTVDGNVLDPMLHVLRAGQRLIGSDGLVVGEDAARSRLHARSSASALRGAAVGVDVSESRILLAGRSIKVRHYRPAGAIESGTPGSRTAGSPLLVYYHGGGFVIGDLDVYDEPCRLICHQSGVQVLAVDYRLAPEHPAPAAVDDAFEAYLWACEHAAELGADPSRVAVGGDSAGGNLAAVVCQLARNAGAPLPTMQCLIYPIVDITAMTRSRTLFANGFFLTKHDIDWFGRQYLTVAGVDAGDPLVSPLRAADLAGLPPALVVTAGFDPLRDEGDSYAAALRQAGVMVDHRQLRTMTHLFVNYAPLGGGPAKAMAEVSSALRAHLTRG